MTKKSTAIDMTTGNPRELLLAFAIPTLLGNILHQVYSITDSIIVGRILGQRALAAIGCTVPIILLLAAMMIGINLGVGILLSQAYGKKDMDRMRKSFANSLYLGIFVAVVMAIVGLLFARPILVWLNTPEGPLQDAEAYLKISFITTFCPLFYYLFSCVFRGMGDSKTVLYCLVVSVGINTVLDYIFVAIFHWGVAGSAWATAIAQGLSAIFAAIVLYIRHPQMRLEKSDWKIDFNIFQHITRLALPIALQSAFLHIGNLFSQSAINGFGEVTMAAYTAGSRIGNFALMPLDTLGNAVAVYTGQNYGAGLKERLKEGLKASYLLNLIISTVLAIGMVLLGKVFISLFLTSPSEELMTISYRYLLINCIPCFFAGLYYIHQQYLRGINRPNAALVGGVVELLVRISIIFIGVNMFGKIDMIWASWPISFFVSSMVLTILKEF